MLEHAALGEGLQRRVGRQRRDVAHVDDAVGDEGHGGIERGQSEQHAHGLPDAHSSLGGGGRAPARRRAGYHRRRRLRWGLRVTSRVGVLAGGIRKGVGDLVTPQAQPLGMKDLDLTGFGVGWGQSWWWWVPCVWTLEFSAGQPGAEFERGGLSWYTGSRVWLLKQILRLKPRK